MTIPDNGCSYHPDCFTCPFPDCVRGQGKPVEETPLYAKRRNKDEARRLFNLEGWGVARLAQLFEVAEIRIKTWVKLSPTDDEIERWRNGQKLTLAQP